MFRKSPSVTDVLVTNVLSQLSFNHDCFCGWVSYHMTSLTMQYYTKGWENERWDTKLPKPFGFKKFFGLWILSPFCYLERMRCVGPTHARWHVWIGYLRWQNRFTTVFYMFEGFQEVGHWWIDCGSVRTWQMDYMYANVNFVFSVDDELQHLYCRDTSCSTLGASPNSFVLGQERFLHDQVLSLWPWGTVRASAYTVV